MRVIVLFVAVFIGVCLLMILEVTLSVGTGSSKVDLLAFLGEYMSFVGVIVVALVLFAHSSYYDEKEMRKRKEECQIDIQYNCQFKSEPQMAQFQISIYNKLPMQP